MKPATAALLNGAALARDGTLNPFPSEIATVSPGFKGVTLHVTEKTITGSDRDLIYHPKTLVMGIGCERNASAEEVIALAKRVLRDNSLAAASLAAIASIDLKSDEAAIHAAAAHFGVPARFFTADELNRETPRLKNPSDIVAKEVGVPAAPSPGPRSRCLPCQAASAARCMSSASAPARLTGVLLQHARRSKPPPTG